MEDYDIKKGGLIMDLHDNINQIIESSSELFAVYGYDGTSISEICKAGNISKGRFYYYFSNKEDLFLSCCKYSYSLVNKIFDMYKFDENLNLMDNFLNLFMCYQNIFEKHKFVPYIVYTINSSPPAAIREMRREIVEFHESKVLELTKEILEKCSIEANVFQVAIGFHTAFIAAYSKDGVFSREDVRTFVGNDVLKSFAYYLDKILFGVIPRDEKTIHNPKASRNT